MTGLVVRETLFILVRRKDCCPLFIGFLWVHMTGFVAGEILPIGYISRFLRALFL